MISSGFYIFLLGMTFLMLTCSCDSSTERTDNLAERAKSIEHRTFEIELDTPKISALRIVNHSTEPVGFRIKVNNGFYFSVDDMLDSIRNLNKQLKEPLERTTWRFVKSLTSNTNRSIRENWFHHPELFLNATGTGQCDDEAAILALLWRRLDFSSRVWILEGHVVPEVYTNGRWQMYDPSMKVFYLNQKGLVASVEEISAHPDLIKKKLSCELPEDVRIRALCQSAKFQHLYASTSNNRLLKNWEPRLSDDKLGYFNLPAGASLEFPGSFTNDKGYFRNRGQVRMTIPKGIHTKINIPLLPYAIIGEGTLKYGPEDSTNYSGFLSFKSTDHPLKGFVPEVTLTTKTQSEIVFSVNPKAISLEDQNTIELFGENIDSISVTAILLDSAEQLQNQYGDRVDRQITDDYNYYMQLNATTLESLKLLPDSLESEHYLESQLDKFVQLDVRIAEKDKRRAQEYLHKKFNNFKSRLPEDSLIYSYMSDYKVFVYLLSMIQSVDEGYFFSN